MTISASQWGSPLAPRRALLVHGLTSSSGCWEGLAQLLVAKGFSVVAPNLIGHGWRQGSDYRMSAIVEDLLPYFAMDTSYDVVIGHSLGGAVVMSLFPFLPKAKETTVILVDPVVELPAEAVRSNGTVIMESVECPKTAEEWMSENPGWSRRDCVLRVLGTSMCSSAGVRDILQRNSWSYSNLLKDIPANVNVTALVADPKICTHCRLEHFPRDVERLRTKVLTGIGHWIQFECPDAIVDAIPQSGL